MRRSSMTRGRKPQDQTEPRETAAPSTEQVEGAAAPVEPGDGSPTDANVADSATNASTEAENADAEGVEADLDALLADVRRERDEYLELARRAKADFENYRKRAAKDTEAAEARGKATLARELVPAVDNLERALKAADADSELARGVELVLRELESTLQRAGVEAYDPVGERFDPAWHEALSTRPADDEEAGVVVETLERGYRLDGQVLRPARVVVSA
jgi:molecular chaperone GrpE